MGRERIEKGEVGEDEDWVGLGLGGWDAVGFGSWVAGNCRVVFVGTMKFL